MLGTLSKGCSSVINTRTAEPFLVTLDMKPKRFTFDSSLLRLSSKGPFTAPSTSVVDPQFIELSKGLDRIHRLSVERALEKDSKNNQQCYSAPQECPVGPTPQQSSPSSPMTTEIQPVVPTDILAIPFVADETTIEAVYDKKASSFWIATGDFIVSIGVCHSPPETLRMFHGNFSQKSMETRQFHFGIDDHKFSTQNPDATKEICKCLPKLEGGSYYWFSTADLTVHFSGKYMPTEKIKRLFDFIRASLECNIPGLGGGIDDFKFAFVPDFRGTEVSSANKVHVSGSSKSSTFESSSHRHYCNFDIASDGADSGESNGGPTPPTASETQRLMQQLQLGPAGRSELKIQTPPLESKLGAGSLSTFAATQESPQRQHPYNDTLAALIPPTLPHWPALIQQVESGPARGFQFQLRPPPLESIPGAGSMSATEESHQCQESHNDTPATGIPNGRFLIQQVQAGSAMYCNFELQKPPLKSVPEAGPISTFAATQYSPQHQQPQNDTLATGVAPTLLDGRFLIQQVQAGSARSCQLAIHKPLVESIPGAGPMSALAATEERHNDALATSIPPTISHGRFLIQRVQSGPTRHCHVELQKPPLKSVPGAGPMSTFAATQESPQQIGTLAAGIPPTVPNRHELTEQVQSGSAGSCQLALRKPLADLSIFALEQCKGLPEYERKLRDSMAVIESTWRETGFGVCTIDLLQRYLYFVSCYSDMCVDNCRELLKDYFDEKPCQAKTGAR